MPQAQHAHANMSACAEGKHAAYQAFDWIKQAQIDRHFSHIGNLQGAGPSRGVVDDRPEIDCPGRCDAVLTEHSSHADLYSTKQIADLLCRGVLLLKRDVL